MSAKSGNAEDVQRRRPNPFVLLVAEWSIINLGHYGVLAVLTLYFLRALQLAPDQAAAFILIFSLSLRLSRILLAPLVDRLAPRSSIMLASLVTALGYLGLSFVTAPAAIIAMLLVIGAGVGSNVLAVKTMAANTVAEGQSSLLRYASLSTGLNFAASIGPLIGTSLFLNWRANGVFLLAAAVNLLAALVTLWMPRGEVSSVQRPSWISGMKVSFARPTMRRAMLFTALTWFLYSQLYATLPLFIESGLRVPTLLGTYLTANAVLVIIGQLPLSQLLARWQVPESRMLFSGYVAFGLGFTLLWLFPTWQIAYAAVVCWTLGEMLIMPLLDTMVAEGVPAENRTVAFALSGLAIGVGDGLGGSIGVALAGRLLAQDQLLLLYGLFAVAAVVAAAVVAGVFRASIFKRTASAPSYPPTS